MDGKDLSSICLYLSGQLNNPCKNTQWQISCNRWLKLDTVLLQVYIYSKTLVMDSQLLYKQIEQGPSSTELQHLHLVKNYLT